MNRENCNTYQEENIFLLKNKAQATRSSVYKLSARYTLKDLFDNTNPLLLWHC